MIAARFFATFRGKERYDIQKRNRHTPRIASGVEFVNLTRRTIW